MANARVLNNRGAQGPCLAWRIENSAPDVADVYLYDVIGDPWAGTTAADFVKALTDLGDVPFINLHINSPGGFVSDGLAMYNAIQQHPAHVTSMIESEASSAASWVALAADDVQIAKNAKVFIHDAMGFAMGNAQDARTLADLLDEESENIASIYADKAGGDPETWREAMQANNGFGTTYRGQAAIDIGLADALMTVPEKASRNKQPLRAVALAVNESPDIDFAELAGWRDAARFETPAEGALESLLAGQNRTESPLSAALKGR